VDLSAVYNENINTCFDHPWDWDHGDSSFGPKKTISYWTYLPFALDTPLPEHLQVGRIPFQICRNEASGGKNLAMIANTPPRELPTGLTIEIGRRVEKIYLLSLNFMLAQKTYVPAVQIELFYTDGSKENRDMVAPYNFDYYAQNSGINTLEYALAGAKLRPDARFRHFPPTLRDIHLTMTDVRCDAGKVLRSVTFKSIATETFFGLSGMTLNVPE
jgi:hypothetical protein